MISLYPDPDQAKGFGTDRIRIQNTASIFNFVKGSGSEMIFPDPDPDPAKVLGPI
jgi:hypothetical protein